MQGRDENQGQDQTGPETPSVSSTPQAPYEGQTYVEGFLDGMRSQQQPEARAGQPTAVRETPGPARATPGPVNGNSGRPHAPPRRGSSGGYPGYPTSGASTASRNGNSGIDNMYYYAPGDLRNPLDIDPSRIGNGSGQVFLYDKEGVDGVVRPTRQFSADGYFVTVTQMEDGLIVQYARESRNPDDRTLETLLETRSNSGDVLFTTSGTDRSDRFFVDAGGGGLLGNSRPWVGVDFGNDNRFRTTDSWAYTTQTQARDMAIDQVQDFFLRSPTLAGLVQASGYPLISVEGAPANLQYIMAQRPRYEVNEAAQPQTGFDGIVAGTVPIIGNGDDLIKEK